MKDTERYVGFYSLCETRDNNGYLGALLITDQYGRPAEFRVTMPVKPSAFQRPLYGDALEPFIGVQLCGKQLLHKMDHTPELLVVSDPLLLDMREIAAYPVVHIQKTGDAFEIKIGENVERGAKAKMSSASGRFQPVDVRTAAGHEDDLDRTRPLLEEAFKNMDLVEPFARIEKALELLAKEDQRFA
jgi:hypothetical protein